MALQGRIDPGGPANRGLKLITPGFVIPTGLPPRRIEILTQISGVDFGKCRSRCEAMMVGGITIPVMALGDLIANKLASGRPKALADVDALRSPN